jgi:hypothetical protein
MRTDIKSGEMTSTNITDQLVPSAREDHPNINLKVQHNSLAVLTYSLRHGNCLRKWSSIVRELHRRKGRNHPLVR